MTRILSEAALTSSAFVVVVILHCQETIHENDDSLETEATQHSFSSYSLYQRLVFLRANLQ